jgi:hypothetical protein
MAPKSNPPKVLIMKIQLPNDVQSQGYTRSSKNLFEFEQVFYSASESFTGSELEFISAGLAYKYIDVNDFKRLKVL